MRKKRALLSVTDKTKIEELARGLQDAGYEIISTGGTKKVLEEAGVHVTPIEKVTGLPESFQGRMKTLSFHVLGGILYQRNDAQDCKDAEELKISPIDVVVVNFYDFKNARPEDEIEKIDIGGPTLVRAAAKNYESVCILTSPHQYEEFLIQIRKGEVEKDFLRNCSDDAWRAVFEYDKEIFRKRTLQTRSLRYGENPHQKANFSFSKKSPLLWGQKISEQELSYNNLLDFSASYELVYSLKKIFSEKSKSVVIFKHGNPCGVALDPEGKTSQKELLQEAWDGDPISAFGGIVCFSSPLEEDTLSFLGSRFVEGLSAPGLHTESSEKEKLLQKKKKMKLLSIQHFDTLAMEPFQIRVCGGTLEQGVDEPESEKLECKNGKTWNQEETNLAQFGIQVSRLLKSNALALVGRAPRNKKIMVLQASGAGQPNRVEALKYLIQPRIKFYFQNQDREFDLSSSILVSDAFFPFRDLVDEAHTLGVQKIVQPGGSIRDEESIQACKEHQIDLMFTGRRHFRHS